MTYGETLDMHINLLISNITCNLGRTLSSCQPVIVALDLVKQYFRTNVLLLDNLFALEKKHPYTYKHSLNVATYAMIIGVESYYNAEELFLLCVGGILHDLGKFYISNDILDKPAKLTKGEYATIKQHPSFGVKLFYNSSKIIDNRVGRIIEQHHEKINGSGYPFGLHSSQIDDSAKIISVADVFDAITTKRSYHDSRSIADGLTFILACADHSELDGQFVKTLISALTHPIGKMIMNSRVS